jgi:Lrp/AsnC family transcriptional regulator for asnA, asnC and gidA
MDDLDLRIIEILRHDGRVSNAGIARAVDVSEGTVRRRLKRLIDENLIEVRVSLNLGRKARTVVGVHVDPQRIDDVLTNVSGLDGVTFACITTGRYDMIVWAEAESAELLSQLITRTIGAIPGVQRTETHVVLSQAQGSGPLSG